MISTIARSHQAWDLGHKHNECLHFVKYIKTFLNKVDFLYVRILFFKKSAIKQ